METTERVIGWTVVKQPDGDREQIGASVLSPWGSEIKVLGYDILFNLLFSFFSVFNIFIFGLNQACKELKYISFSLYN